MAACVCSVWFCVSECVFCVYMLPTLSGPECPDKVRYYFIFQDFLGVRVRENWILNGNTFLHPKSPENTHEKSCVLCVCISEQK